MPDYPFPLQDGGLAHLRIPDLAEFTKRDAERLGAYAKALVLGPETPCAECGSYGHFTHNHAARVAVAETWIATEPDQTCEACLAATGEAGCRAFCAEHRPFVPLAEMRKFAKGLDPDLGPVFGRDVVQVLDFVEAIGPFVRDVLDQPFPWKNEGLVAMYLEREEYERAVAALRVIRRGVTEWTG